MERCKGKHSDSFLARRSQTDVNATSYRKLDEWDDEDNFGPSVDPAEEGPAANKSRVVVLKHMFTLEELEEDVALLLDLKADVRDECSGLGEVTNVVLYDVRFPNRRLSRSPVLMCIPAQKEPDGVMTVKFREPIAAQACVVVCTTFSASLSPKTKAFVRKCMDAFSRADRSRPLFSMANNGSNGVVLEMTLARRLQKRRKRSGWTSLQTG